jgi:hypothetical protein
VNARTDRHVKSRLPKAGRCRRSGAWSWGISEPWRSHEQPGPRPSYRRSPWLPRCSRDPSALFIAARDSGAGAFCLVRIVCVERQRQRGHVLSPGLPDVAGCVERLTESVQRPGFLVDRTHVVKGGQCLPVLFDGLLVLAAVQVDVAEDGKPERFARLISDLSRLGQCRVDQLERRVEVSLTPCLTPGSSAGTNLDLASVAAHDVEQSGLEVEDANPRRPSG